MPRRNRAPAHNHARTNETLVTLTDHDTINDVNTDAETADTICQEPHTADPATVSTLLARLTANRALLALRSSRIIDDIADLPEHQQQHAITTRLRPITIATETARIAIAKLRRLLP